MDNIALDIMEAFKIRKANLDTEWILCKATDNHKRMDEILAILREYDLLLTEIQNIGKKL